MLESHSVTNTMLTSKQAESCCEAVFDFSSLVLIGISSGILLLLWLVLRIRQEVNYSFCDILKQTYCGCLYKQNENIRPRLRSRLDSINYPAPRTSRSWSDVTGMTAVLSRVHAYRKDVPPPPYEAPPSYHVALRMESQEGPPPYYRDREGDSYPLYQQRETFIV